MTCLREALRRRQGTQLADFFSSLLIRHLTFLEQLVHEHVPHFGIAIELHGFGVVFHRALALAADGVEFGDAVVGAGIFFVAVGFGLSALVGTFVEEDTKNIKVDHVYQGVEDKLEAFQHILKDLNVRAEECMFMGDDVIDLPPMRRAGLAVTVPHAMPLVKEYAHYITTREAGHGAVRELCELIMKAQGTFDGQMAKFLK